ncbi:MAG TPA: 16S rRNA (guanine(966)-N(2))-methyltransferase RsmD, partial [Janthinobacterium sp.]|nr:16S rRNA (guanine(966)-N(2))-methyltransferase RsmD [Janthinobacterium sp.]
MQKPKKPAKVPVHHAPHSNQVRIIGGAWKRTALPVLDALGLRPTPDRVRETVFNWINHLRDGAWAGAECLDLFAGSGALGFEAASRGALGVTMVDSLT